MRKYLIILVVMIFYTSGSKGQIEWAPVGSQYNYVYSFFSFDLARDDLVSYAVVDELMWQGKMAKQIQCLPNAAVDFCSTQESRYEYIEDRKHYIWASDFQEYRLLYDYSKKEGESWMVYQWNASMCSDSFMCTVDSIAIDNYDGIKVPVHYIDVKEYYSGSTADGQSGILNFKERISENIGGLTGLRLNEFYYCDLIFDPPPDEISNLHCYIRNDSLEIVFAGEGRSCDDLTTSNEILDDVAIRMWPNPVQDQLYFSGESWENFIIIDRLGKIVLNGNLSHGDDHVNVNILGSGVYFIQFLSDNGIAVSSFIKL